MRESRVPGTRTGTDAVEPGQGLTVVCLVSGLGLGGAGYGAGVLRVAAGA